MGLFFFILLPNRYLLSHVAAIGLIPEERGGGVSGADLRDEAFDNVAAVLPVSMGLINSNIL